MSYPLIADALDKRLKRRATCALFGASLLVAFAACKDSAASREGAPNGSAPTATKVAAPMIDFGGTSYKVTSLAAVGSVTGQVAFDSSVHTAAVADTMPVDSSACDTRRRVSKPSAARSPVAVVWIAGLTAGKAFSIDKRAELSSEWCVLEPRVQAVSIATTVNIVNDDKVLHTLVFTRDGTRDTLTRTPFFNAGQVVASERLAKTPGLVLATCAQHSAERAHIAVFGHPYYAVTDDAGRFTIDSVPPGTYVMHVWREGAAQPTQREISVTAGAAATANVVVR